MPQDVLSEPDAIKKKGRQAYERRRDLPRLIAVWPHELDAGNNDMCHVIVRKLRAALRAERQRGLAGHWTYDVTRHAQLALAYRTETALLHGKAARNNNARDRKRGRR